MIRFSFKLPQWLQWLIPASIRADQDRRIGVTGKASTSFWGGILTVHSEKK